MTQGIPQHVRTAIFVGAVVIFLLFAGISAYRSLYPVGYWIVDCSVKDTYGRVISSRISPRLVDGPQVKDFIAWGERQGETCTVTAVREYLYARTRHRP